MNQPISRKIAVTIAILMLLEIALQTMAVFILGKTFDFPDVLRKPVREVLELFYVNQQSVVSGYYLFLLSSLLYIPLTALLAGNLSEQINQKSTWRIMLISSGLATAVFQSIGFSRWIFVIPILANAYVASETTAIVQQNIEMNYTLLNTYSGMTIGEHLGFITMACWTVSVAMLVPFHKGFKWAGVVIAMLLLVSILENFQGVNKQILGQVNFVANSLWTVWLFLVALSLIFYRKIFVPNLLPGSILPIK